MPSSSRSGLNGRFAPRDGKAISNENVIPTIRTEGTYSLDILDEDLKTQIEDGNADIEYRSWEAECKTKEDIQDDFKAILDEEKNKEKDEEPTVKVEKDVINKDTTILEKILTEMVSLRSEIADVKAQNAQLVTSMQSIKKVLVKDRVAAPADTEKQNILVVVDTRENDIDRYRFPYNIIRCQKRTLDQNFKHFKGRYKDATILYKLENPSAPNFFYALKEKIDGVKVKFYYNYFYLQEDSTINDIIAEITKIEQDRIKVE